MCLFPTGALLSGDVHTELKYREEEMMEEKGGKESNFLLPFFLSVKNDEYESDKPVSLSDSAQQKRVASQSLLPRTPSPPQTPFLLSLYPPPASLCCLLTLVLPDPSASRTKIT